MRGVAHSPAFKAKMIEKMLHPAGPSAYALASQVNVSQSTLSKWRRDALTLDGMTSKKKSSGRRKNRSVEEKLRLVHEASQLPDEELGAFLRREGVHESQLEQWRELVHEAFGKQTPESRRREKDVRDRNRVLERELNRKDKALAESAALLWLKKKTAEIWGDEDDDTSGKSDR